jgi:hypothetical protein
MSSLTVASWFSGAEDMSEVYGCMRVLQGIMGSPRSSIIRHASSVTTYVASQCGRQTERYNVITLALQPITAL